MHICPSPEEYSGQLPTVFRSKAGCGYGEHRDFIKFKDGKRLLCVNVDSNRMYFDYCAGDFEEQDEGDGMRLEVAENTHLSHSPLWGTYLFDMFLEHEYGIKRKRPANEK